ncbi:MAG TPA: hypothetical protein VFX33_08765 [Actinomycetales bacterium]|nr:hypothetical protein [Actinomycetales bacterium]
MTTAPSDGAPIHLRDAESRADLGTYVGRAKRVDPDGDARLVGHGLVLAAYVSPLHGGDLPTVLGLRTYGLAQPWDGDVLAPLKALADRLARTVTPPTLAIPPVLSTGVAWAGVSPPRSGWELAGEVRGSVLSASAAAGIAEIAEGVPDGAGSAAVARLRSAVWSRTADWSTDAGVDVPDGAAFAAETLGFLAGDDDTQVHVYRRGSWTRLSSPLGHVLVRRSLLG